MSETSDTAATEPLSQEGFSPVTTENESSCNMGSRTVSSSTNESETPSQVSTKTKRLEYNQHVLKFNFIFEFTSSSCVLIIFIADSSEGYETNS